MTTFFVIAQIDIHIFCVSNYMLRDIILNFIQAERNTTITFDESTRGVNVSVGNELTKRDNHSDPTVNEDFFAVSSSSPTDANKDGNRTGVTSVEMSDMERDITRAGHKWNLSFLGTGEEEPASHFVYKAFQLVYKSYYNEL